MKSNSEKLDSFSAFEMINLFPKQEDNVFTQYDRKIYSLDHFSDFGSFYELENPRNIFEQNLKDTTCDESQPQPDGSACNALPLFSNKKDLLMKEAKNRDNFNLFLSKDTKSELNDY